MGSGRLCGGGGGGGRSGGTSPASPVAASSSSSASSCASFVSWLSAAEARAAEWGDGQFAHIKKSRKRLKTRGQAGGGHADAQYGLLCGSLILLPEMSRGFSPRRYLRGVRSVARPKDFCAPVGCGATGTFCTTTQVRQVLKPAAAPRTLRGTPLGWPWPSPGAQRCSAGRGGSCPPEPALRHISRGAESCSAQGLRAEAPRWA